MSSLPPRPDTTGSLPPRPGTASLARPGTSSGRRSLAALDSQTHSAPDREETTQSTLQKSIGGDSFLRIISAGNVQSNHEALVWSETGNVEGIVKLQTEGFDFTQCRGLNGFTPLHHACNRGHAAVVAVLLRARMSINAKNDFGESPLHLAVMSGNMLLVEQLIDMGADINQLNSEGETALFYAARKSMPSIVRLLLARGANPEIVDKYDEKAIDHASNPGTLKSFKGVTIEQTGLLTYKDLLHVFEYLKVNDILRCACVNVKWHRVSENESIWKRLGVHRWELALQSSLGFSAPAATSFLSRRPSASSSRSNSNRSLTGSQSSKK